MWHPQGAFCNSLCLQGASSKCLVIQSLAQPEMCSERDSPLKRLYRWTYAKLTRLAGFGQLLWAAGCELSLALIHAWRPVCPGETSETILRVAPPCKTRSPNHTRVNWPVDASASGSAQMGSGGHHRWAARVHIGREPARQKAREGYPSHYTSLAQHNADTTILKWNGKLQAIFILCMHPANERRCYMHKMIPETNNKFQVNK